MISRKSGRLAIHRRSDEIAFLQHRLRILGDAQVSHTSHGAQESAREAAVEPSPYPIDVEGEGRDLQFKVLARERDLADELQHTRQIEPLGETLQRRLAMAERICHDLMLRSTDGENLQKALDVDDDRAGREHLPDTYWVVEIERRALGEMLNQWWAWLSES